VKELDNDRLVWMFTQMARVREFEERVKGTFEEHPGVIRGTRISRMARRRRLWGRWPRSSRRTSS